VAYAVTGTATGSGTDYTLANGTLTISAGATSGTITIAGIVADSLDEADETVIVTLSSPGNATLGSNTVHTYTITDDDSTPTVQHASTSSSGAESTSSQALTVNVSAASGQDVTVAYNESTVEIRVAGQLLTLPMETIRYISFDGRLGASADGGEEGEQLELRAAMGALRILKAQADTLDTENPEN